MRAMHDKSIKGRVYDNWTSAVRRYPTGLWWPSASRSPLEMVFRQRMRDRGPRYSGTRYSGTAFLANEVLSRVEIPFAGPLTAPARAIHFGMLPDNPPRKPWMRNELELHRWPSRTTDRAMGAPVWLHHSMMTTGGKK